MSEQQLEKPLDITKAYADWLRSREPDLFWPPTAAAQLLNGLQYRPLFSIILHVDGHDPELLQCTVNSIASQIYRGYEVILVGHPDKLKAANPLLQELLKKEIPVAFANVEHSDCPAACKEASLRLCSGEYVLLPHCEDELHPQALVEFLRALNLGQCVPVLYSDEDFIGSNGVRRDPVFKADCDADMLLSFNCIGQLICFGKSLLDQLPVFPTVSGEAGLWDLTLRAYEQVGCQGFRHIPKPLYHRRIRDTSKLQRNSQADSRLKQQLDVLQGYLDRNAISAHAASGLVAGTVRVRYAKSRASAAVVVRAIDGAYQLVQLAPFVFASRARVYEAIASRLYSVPTRGEGTHSTNAFSITQTDVEILVFINRPIETVNHEFLDELIAQAGRSECGVVTGIALTPARKIAHSAFLATKHGSIDVSKGRRFPSPSYLSQMDVVHSTDSVHEYFFAVRTDHIARAGAFAVFDSHNPKRFLRVLLTYTGNAGLRHLITPYAVATVVLDDHLPGLPALAFEQSNHRIKLNPNIEDFADPATFYRSVT